MAALERPKSLTELVTEEVRRRIVVGEFAMGDSLSEARLAKELEISRTPVREALNRLEMEGLVRTEPQKGTYVFELDPSELKKICDARVCLETTALRAAIRINPVSLSETLAQCVARMAKARDAGDNAAYLAEDTHFHQSFFEHSDNRFLNDAFQTIASKMAALRNQLGNHPDHMAKSYAEHIRIADAVKERDDAKATRILKSHIDRKEGSYWLQASDA